MLRAWLIGEVILFVSLRAKVSHEKSLFNACRQKEKVPPCLEVCTMKV